MNIAAAVREAKLRPERAGRYPTLPVSRWTSATSLAELVAACPSALPEEPDPRNHQRTLPEADFEFRGGSPRRAGR